MFNSKNDEVQGLSVLQPQQVPPCLLYHLRPSNFKHEKLGGYKRL